MATTKAAEDDLQLGYLILAKHTWFVLQGILGAVPSLSW